MGDQMVDSRSFDATIVTPEGTPLGGWVHLEIHRSGDYSIEFHMHSSSIFGSFDFQLRAYLNAPDSPALFFLHSGHVSGVDDSNWPESGNNPLLALYADQFLDNGSFNVAKDYSWGGVVGAVEGLVHDVLDVVGGAAGAAVGAVIGVTREAIGWLGTTLGPGGTLGVVAGVVVFAVGTVAGAGVGGALILGIVAGVAVGAVTNALIEYRGLNPAEISLARQVFGDTLDYDKVVITNLGGLNGRAFTAPGVDGKTYCNLGHGYDSPLGSQSSAYWSAGQLLIHELTHAWQVQHTAFLPGLMCSGIVNQVDYQFGDNVYAYGPAGPGWSEFNLEQQGAIVDQWFGGDRRNEAGYYPMDQRSPYYRYIWADLLGRTPSPFAPANLPTSPTLAVARAWNHLDVFWVGPDGSVSSNWWDANGGWQKPFQIAPAGSAAPGAITAVARTPEHIDVFWVGPDGGVGSNWWDASVGWQQPFAIAPPGSARGGAVVAVSRRFDHIDVFWVGPDGGVGTNWWDAGDNKWHTPYPIAPAGSAQPGALTAASRTPDHIDVFWIGPDGGVASSWWDANVNNAAWNAPFPIAPPASA